MNLKQEKERLGKVEFLTRRSRSAPKRNWMILADLEEKAEILKTVKVMRDKESKEREK